jgi:tetratricopeptide (TPR) repeat protein
VKFCGELASLPAIIDMPGQLAQEYLRNLIAGYNDCQNFGGFRMHCQPTRIHPLGPVASLLSLCSSLVILFSPSLAIAAPNPQANPHFNAAMVSDRPSAIARMEKQDFPGAIQELSEAIRIDPALVDAYELRGILHLGSKDYPKAVADFTKATQLEPKNVDAHINLSKAYIASKNYPAALRSATTAKQLDPQS